jgi:long-chain-fatty-acyl-CoA reductase
LPIVIGGERTDRTSSGDFHQFETPTGARLALPVLAAEDTDRLLAQNRGLLADLGVQDILAFLNRAGKNWRSEEYARRRLYVRQLEELIGYSAQAANAEADRIAILLNSHSRMYDLIEAELGSRFIVDDWVPREESQVKALPRGLVVHLLPGNVPLSAALSVVRGLITKNLTVAKLASGDPLTAVALALTFVDLDPRHPVTLSMSAVYWDHESAAGQRIVAGADAVCAWGGADAIRYARRHARDDAPVTCFGPKQSLAIVDTAADPARAARGLAHDVAVYDQQACFSVRRVFVTGPLEPFLTELRAAMREHAELLPPGVISLDQGARVQLERRVEEFFGGAVEGDEELAWTIVTGPPPDPDADHPLGRILFVHPVESIAEAYPFAGPEVQTVAAHPWELLLAHRDELARRGVSRLVELGLVHLFRVGGTHDGVNSLQGLVRFAGTEAPGRVFGKGMVVRLDETSMLKAGTLKDLVL